MPGSFSSSTIRGSEGDRLLSRDAFREAVFARDRHCCVVCQASDLPLDAHHILERKLWTEEGEKGGYFLDNGVSVCETHHRAAEDTTLSPNQLRLSAGIGRELLPSALPALSDGWEYDKWGNTVAPNGRRLRGPLFDDPGVQKILAPLLPLFEEYIKYPRTPHLPWSNPAKGDVVAARLDRFVAAGRVVVTEKMDGSCATLTRDRVYGRSTEPISGKERPKLIQLWSRIHHDIPDGWRICGEDLYARHAIAYTGLRAYFLGISVWTETNHCLSWDDTREWFELLEIEPVPVLYQGVWNESEIRRLWHAETHEGNREGYVVRVGEAFHYTDFALCVAKFVGPGHVPTLPHRGQDGMVVSNTVL